MARALAEHRNYQNLQQPICRITYNAYNEAVAFSGRAYETDCSNSQMWANEIVDDAINVSYK